jgi:hypothetical protein
VPTYLEKKIKPFTKLFERKQFCKSSYTIPNGSIKEKCDEQTKVETNASQLKITFVQK